MWVGQFASWEFVAKDGWTQDTPREIWPPVEDTGGVSDDPTLPLFTTCIARLVSVPQRGVGFEVTA